MSTSHRIGAFVYDLRASGVVRNLIRIVAHARAESLDIEIWPVRPQGEFLEEALDVAPVNPILPAAATTSRDLDCLLHQRAMAAAIRQRSPSLMFSAGNHMHVHLALARARLAPQCRPRYLGRASNSVVCAGKQSRLARSLIEPLERYQYAAMDHVITVSEELRTQLIHALQIAPQRITTVANGVDLETSAGEVATVPPTVKSARPLILGIGRLSKQKDFVTLIQAVARLKMHPLPELRILGRGSPRWQRILNRQAQHCGITDRFTLCGHVDDVRAHLRSADIFVSSSRWEGASNVILEALACGTPIVATQAPTGIHEVLAPLGAQLLVPLGDPGALARAIAHRLGQARESHRLIEHARRYDLARTLSAYATVLHSQLEMVQGTGSTRTGETQSTSLQHS